jgi:eukaryotic-like serine/threonine-protein kinase
MLDFLLAPRGAERRDSTPRGAPSTALPSSVVPLDPGLHLGPYEILAPLGAGGMGEVYRTRDTRLDRDVAVKILPADVGLDPERRRRFEGEAQALAALSHPNVLAIYDIGSEKGVLFLVSELLEGETLRERLSRGPLPWRRAAEIGSLVAAGLAAAHGRGIVHRDLKPENLFLTAEGQLKILDFGLARETRSEAGRPETTAPTLAFQTSPGTVVGTVGYMSPEQIRGAAVDARSDIFSLGCVLYEMLAGTRPFRAATAAETMAAILKETPPAIAGAGTAAPPELEHIVAHCLEKDPDERFQSVRDLAFDLRAVAAISGSGPAVGHSAPATGVLDSLEHPRPLRLRAAAGRLPAGEGGGDEGP